MILTPANLDELQTLMREAFAAGRPIDKIDLRHFQRVIEHAPEDMTATVEGGISLQELQRSLAQGGQWLPVDPPRAARLTVAELLLENWSGPRRFGYGLVREHVLGMKVVLADGQLIRTGGKVVKNVAGYDLAKLFIGSRGSLGWIVEATFKLRPLPEVEKIATTEFEELAAAAEAVERILESRFEPVILDWHARDFGSGLGGSRLTIGFAGTSEEVEDQLAELNGWYPMKPGDLQYETQFWAGEEAGPVRALSVLPSRLIETVRELGGVWWVSRAGNGLIHYRGGPVPAVPEMPLDLMARVKDAYDPKKIFPQFQL